ncbi:RagB/SusD family nutrient uptake outer membrane protein [Parapedobacter sp. DT-150]|uniref:RagB/SusD family nutrient uptake outer membrane protein n=1 Tax=Parapedobacter sp. DT-150 TaxID=3396162 RepID=UPI003F1A1BEB
MESAYAVDGSAIAVLTGIYMRMSQEDVLPGQGVKSTSVVAGLSSDELKVEGTNGITAPELIALATNELTPVSPNSWNNFYNKVYRANAAIEGLMASNTLNPNVKQQLLGEAFFLRAFYYFYLVNFYGDVPLALTTDYTVTMGLSRSPQAEVYGQIIADLLEAEKLLSADYLSGNFQGVGQERVRPTKGAARALLARAHLYINDFASAENYASAVIEDNERYALTELDGVFLNGSQEAIWQLPSVGGGNITNTHEGRAFIVDENTNFLNGANFDLATGLLDAFENGDGRRSSWVKEGISSTLTPYVYAYKYKVGWGPLPKTESSMVVRLGEIYLIRAESRARQGDISGAQADLNIIRSRAGLPTTVAATAESLLLALEQERRVELFTEWGHRFFDLKRWGKVDEVLSQKGSAWQTTDQLYPLPQSELNSAPSLHQNPGY